MATEFHKTTIAGAKALTGEWRRQGRRGYVEGKGFYYYDTATTAADSDNCLVPDGITRPDPGGWLREQAALDAAAAVETANAADGVADQAAEDASTALGDVEDLQGIVAPTLADATLSISNNSDAGEPFHVKPSGLEDLATFNVVGGIDIATSDGSTIEAQDNGGVPDGAPVFVNEAGNDDEKLVADLSAYGSESVFVPNRDGRMWQVKHSATPGTTAFKLVGGTAVAADTTGAVTHHASAARQFTTIVPTLS